MTTIKLRRGLAATFATNNPVLQAGEPAFATDTGVLKIGDGTTAYNSLPSIGASPDLSNYVTTNTTQTISGAKTFSISGSNNLLVTGTNTSSSGILLVNRTSSGRAFSAYGSYGGISLGTNTNSGQNYAYITNDQYTGDLVLTNIDSFHKIALRTSNAVVRIPSTNDGTPHNGTDYPIIHGGNISTYLPSTFTGADGTNAGATGLVPAPAATDNNKFLKGDGTWAEASGGGGAQIDDNNVTTTTTYSSSKIMNSITAAGTSALESAAEEFLTPTEVTAVANSGIVVTDTSTTTQGVTTPGIGIGTSGLVKSSTITNMVKLTQTEYDALTTKDANTFYVIVAAASS